MKNLEVALPIEKPEALFRSYPETYEIYLYDEISEELSLLFVEAFNKIEQKAYIDSITNKDVEIKIHINSPGGDLFSGFLIYDILNQSRVKTIGIAEGLCASAATIILCGCDVRKAYNNSTLMLHQLSSGASGTYEELASASRNYDQLMERMKDLYLENLSIDKPTLETKLKNNDYWTPQVALKNGLLEEIIKPKVKTRISNKKQVKNVKKEIVKEAK